jgi:AcrR family transcriptional regulator
MVTKDAPAPSSPSARDALLKAAVEELVEKGHASVSLRAVARRAGVSHAAPAHFFGDRAGMLTAVATDGFGRLAVAMRTAGENKGTAEERFAALGLAYLDFGLDHPALADLMFRRAELAPNDAGLVKAQRAALEPLRSAVAELVADQAEEWSMLSWAVVHGLVALVREEALTRVAGKKRAASADYARRLVGLYACGVTAATQPSRRKR